MEELKPNKEYAQRMKSGQRIKIDNKMIVAILFKTVGSFLSVGEIGD